MKKLSFRRNLSVILMLMLLPCFSGKLWAQQIKTPDGVGDNYVFALTNDTAFQVMGLHTDGSVMLIKMRNNSNVIEKIAFRRTDTSSVFLMHFDQNGNPELAVYRKQMICFSNFKDQKADILICYNDGKNKELKGVDFALPQPMKMVTPNPRKAEGPANYDLQIDPATLTTALGYASTALGVASCAIAFYTAGAYALPCVSALLDVASKVLPEKYGKTRLALDFAGTILSGRSFLKAETMNRLESWQQIYSGITYVATGLDNWVQAPAQRERIPGSTVKEKTYPDRSIEPGSNKADASINKDDFNTIISLYNEGEAKMAAQKKTMDELRATLTEKNYQEVGPKIEKLNNEIDAAKKEYQTKINAIAAKKTIVYGFHKSDSKSYSIKKIVITGARWNSKLYLTYDVLFSAIPVTESDQYTNKPVETYLTMMEAYYMDEKNVMIEPKMLAVNKKMRDSGLLSSDMTIDLFKKVAGLNFNTSIKYKPGDY